MARRKQSPLEDVVDIISKFPWWVGMLLAIIFYFVLHAYAVQKIAVASDPHDFGQTINKTVLHSMALFGQYILPLVFLLGGGLSAFNQFSRKKLHQNVAESSSKNALNGMSWQQFETLVGEHFRQQGYKVEEVGGGGADGGVDIILHKNGEKHFVQCKQWKAYKVGVKPVRELLGVMVGSAATGGIVVTSGEFTKDAIDFARENNIQLLDGTELHKVIRNAKQAVIPASIPKVPTCPKCGSNMVKRTAKKGSHAGEPFWGCSGYPACRSTLPMHGECA